MSTRSLRLHVLLLAALAFGFSGPGRLWAQQEESQETDATRGRGALYFLTPDDQLAIRVNVWGFVAKPGQYVVPKDTDLIAMISYAGGPLQDAKLKSVRVIRDHTPQLADLYGAAVTDPYRRGELKKVRQEVIEVNVKKYLGNGDHRMIPGLQPGDTVVVPGSRMQSVTRFLDLFAKVLVVTQIYFYLRVANN